MSTGIAVEDAPRRGASTGAWARRVLRRTVRGRAGTARWEQPAYLGLLVSTAVLYVVNLSVNGYANAFYSAAVQAGSQSWEAFFFGSSDAGNSITVDKPPAFLWVMELSVRVFGLNSWAILVPEAIMGVLSVALLHAIVRRRFSAGAALIAGAALASTPVATLMFRFNNPDALLTLLMVLSIWLVLRAVETDRLRYLVWAGVAIGFAFLTKQLQAFLILPVLVGVVLYCSRLPFWKRIVHLLWAALAIVVAGGWWVAIVSLVPASARPYIGGSQTNSFLELTFGYNGFGRVTGDETGSVTGGGGGATTTGGTWGATGITRLFGSEFAAQITWLLPTALVLLVAALVSIGFRRRTSARLATVLALGGSLLVTGLVFSFMGGIFHPYYTVALAPYIAGLVGIGAAEVWRRCASDRSGVRTWVWRGVAALALVVTVVWQWHLLAAAGTWQPWIKWVVLVAGVLAAAAVLVPVASAARGLSHTAGGRAGDVSGSGAGATGVFRPLDSAARGAAAASASATGRAGEMTGLGAEGTAAHRPLDGAARAASVVTGSPVGRAGEVPGSGAGTTRVFRPLDRGRGVPAGWERVPTVSGEQAGRRAWGVDTKWARPLRIVAVTGALIAGLLAPFASSVETVATAHTGSLPSAGPTVTGAGFGGGGPGGQGAPGGRGGAGGPGTTGGGTGNGTGGPGGFGGQPGSATGGPGGGGGGGTTGMPGGSGTFPGQGERGAAGGMAGGAGGLLGGSTDIDETLAKALQSDADDYRWAAAVVGSNNAATYQLGSGESVMPIGGFNGSDPSPTLAEFEQDVASGDVHYFIAGSSIGASNGGSDAASEITSWVEANFTSETIGGVTVYDLSAG